MVRPSKTLNALLESFVCVRVTDMRGVDLSRFDFDFDLTFAVLTMDGAGQVYHRYGGRDERGAETWLSEASLERTLEVTLLEHEAAAPMPAVEPREPLRLEEVASFKKRDKGECIHCHSVNTSLYEEARDKPGFDVNWIWKHPTPARIGIDLDRDDQRLVTAVEVGSSAALAKLFVGDRLVSVGGVSVATASDLMFALDRTSPQAGKLELVIERKGVQQGLTLSLKSDWKRATPREFAWRPTKWALTPAPGFGGPQLSPEELAGLGLARERFAFRVQYLVTWGDTRRFGQAAAMAGVREGDVVLSVGGKSNFDSIDHFHAWWRLRVQPGQDIAIELLREGEPVQVSLRAIP